MSATASNRSADCEPESQPPILEVFELRCWARALLYGEHLLTLHDAVDALQIYAELSGLVDVVGQDAVQAIMAREFGAMNG